jgi:hypothetical protein
MSYETLKRVQGDSQGVFRQTQSPQLFTFCGYDTDLEARSDVSTVRSSIYSDFKRHRPTALDRNSLGSTGGLTVFSTTEFIIIAVQYPYFELLLIVKAARNPPCILDFAAASS